MKTCPAVGIILCLFAAVASAQKEGGQAMTFQLSSKAFANQAPIPVRYTGQGPDVSPPLEWVNTPEKTVAFALVCDDPDAPAGDWVHWLLYDIPAAVRSLAESLPRSPKVLGSAKQGLTDFGHIGYNGPMPPPGKVHRYSFRLYALDAATGLDSGATKTQLLRAMQGHILGVAELVGTYRR